MPAPHPDPAEPAGALERLANLVGASDGSALRQSAAGQRVPPRVWVTYYADRVTIEAAAPVGDDAREWFRMVEGVLDDPELRPRAWVIKPAVIRRYGGLRSLPPPLAE